MRRGDRLSARERPAIAPISAIITC